MSTRMSEYTSDRMPDRLPECMSDRMRDRMSEYMSDSLSEYLKNVQTYVMVGITRRKVILHFEWNWRGLLWIRSSQRPTFIFINCNVSYCYFWFFYFLLYYILCYIILYYSVYIIYKYSSLVLSYYTLLYMFNQLEPVLNHLTSLGGCRLYHLPE